MFVPVLPAALATLLVGQRAVLNPRIAVSPCATVTKYEHTHRIVSTYTGVVTVLATETSTVYSPTSGVPKPTHDTKSNDSKVIWAIPAHFPSTTPAPSVSSTDNECIVSTTTNAGTTTETLMKLATATKTSTRYMTVTVPVAVTIPPLPPRLRVHATA